MSTDSGAPQGAVPPAAASDDHTADDRTADHRTAEAAAPASPEQIYLQTMARLAAISDQWRQAREALLRR